MRLEPGTRVGPYEIVAPLGAGGVGEVYRARDTKLSRDVAIKVLPAFADFDPDRTARFKREALALAALNHPHVATVYGLEDAGGDPAIAMELVEGPSLADRLAPGPLAVSEALALARQIADGLDAAHARGIIHRDLKPQNIKLTSGGSVKLLDFGLAKIGERLADPAPVATSPTITAPALTGIGTIFGTAAYMAPEQARGHATDHRADIWAFGCVLFEMLTGRRAFVGASTTDVLAAILQSEPDWSLLPSAIPSPAQRLIRRCLQKPVDRRLHSVRDAILDIDDALAPTSVDVRVVP